MKVINMCKNLNNKRGFTLAELLVVVAILAILVAVSIPIFTGRLDYTKKTVCDANKRSLKAHIGATILQDDDKTELHLKNLLEKYQETDKAKCPEGGTYVIYGNFDDGFSILCSVHDDDGTMRSEITRELLYSALSDVIKEDYGKNFSSYLTSDSAYVDSGADSDRRNLLKPVFEDVLKVDSSNIKTWAICGKPNALKLYWNDKEINGLTPGKDKVSALCYDFKQKKYYVRSMNITPGYKDYGKYNGMKMESTLGNQNGYDTYEEAYDAYKKAQE